MASIIEVEALTKSYGGKRGVAGVSFAVAEGDAFGFLGPNGAGKTTTIRLLMALLYPDGGRATVAGLDPWKQAVEVKRLTGYVPGEPALEPDLTGGQIIEYFGNLRGGVDRAYQKQLIERLDLDTSRKFRQYSSGNKRKVVLIQAFMHRPKLLVLDEPTNGLDPLNQQTFAQMVREAREWGATVFLSSHILSEVEQLCGEVAIIRDGEIVRSGSVAQLKDIKHYVITLTFETPVASEAFAGLEGVSQVEPVGGGQGLQLVMQGSPDAVVKAAAQHPLLSLTSHEPSLEDIFLRYYGGDRPEARQPEEARHA